MNYYKAFQDIFLEIDKKFFNLSEKEILLSKEVKLVANLIPRWFEVIKKGFRNHEKEAFRTLKHIFKTLKVYFSLYNKQFQSNVHKDNLVFIRNELTTIYDFNPLVFPLILLFHDIGRPFNRTWHTLESKKIVQKYSLLHKFNLNDLEKNVILTVIEQHLLIGTIFTGESSYLGGLSLWNSIKKLDSSLSDEIIELTFKSLRIFTVIDIWGYEYSTIYDHYFKYYTKISDNLVDTLKNARNINTKFQEEFLEKELTNLDIQNLQWRIACSLRVFQFINTEDYLTKDFYYSKIEEGLRKSAMNWEEFKRKLGNNNPKIQFKYALPIMMILAMEKFKRKPIDENSNIKPNLFQFWIECCEKLDNVINKRTKLKSSLFYYVFELPRTWFLKDKYIIKVRSNRLIDQIKQGKFVFNKKIYGYILHISI